MILKISNDIIVGYNDHNLWKYFLICDSADEIVVESANSILIVTQVSIVHETADFKHLLDIIIIRRCLDV